MCLSNAGIGFVKGASVDVSILVLVDVSLECIVLYLRGELNHSFNPCFSGCVSRIIARCAGRKWRLVSILVLVDVSLELGWPESARDLRGKFQSLF